MSDPSPPPYTPLPTTNPPRYAQIYVQPPSAAAYSETGGYQTAARSRQTGFVPGLCPGCQRGVLVTSFTPLGVLCACFLFPIGIICCLAFSSKRCPVCHGRFGGC
eukprot:m.309854 g.309854  ORF g.309854 m.309854 type:complete len:105 (+) comp48290_c0_seq1:124-438(+)